jgi:hypothetical protein
MFGADLILFFNARYSQEDERKVLAKRKLKTRDFFTALAQKLLAALSIEREKTGYKSLTFSSRESISNIGIDEVKHISTQSAVIVNIITNFFPCIFSLAREQLSIFFFFLLV